MSEEKKKRTVEEIRNEYGSLCAKVGHAEYQIYVLNKDLDMMKRTLEDLNFEAAAANAEAQKLAESKPSEATNG